jgi:hypothetical protein
LAEASCGTLATAVLDPAGSSKPQLVQHNKGFHPHVLVPVGATVDFPIVIHFFTMYFHYLTESDLTGDCMKPATNSVKFDWSE